MLTLPHCSLPACLPACRPAPDPIPTGTESPSWAEPRDQPLSPAAVVHGFREAQRAGSATSVCGGSATPFSGGSPFSMSSPQLQQRVDIRLSSFFASGSSSGSSTPLPGCPAGDVGGLAAAASAAAASIPSSHTSCGRCSSAPCGCDGCDGALASAFARAAYALPDALSGGSSPTALGRSHSDLPPGTGNLSRKSSQDSSCALHGDSHDSQELFYRLNHARQTMDFVRRQVGMRGARGGRAGGASWAGGDARWAGGDPRWAGGDARWAGGDARWAGGGRQVGRRGTPGRRAGAAGRQWTASGAMWAGMVGGPHHTPAACP